MKDLLLSLFVHSSLVNIEPEEWEEEKNEDKLRKRAYNFHSVFRTLNDRLRSCRLTNEQRIWYKFTLIVKRSSMHISFELIQLSKQMQITAHWVIYSACSFYKCLSFYLLRRKYRSHLPVCVCVCNSSTDSPVVFTHSLCAYAKHKLMFTQKSFCPFYTEYFYRFPSTTRHSLHHWCCMLFLFVLLST